MTTTTPWHKANYKKNREKIIRYVTEYARTHKKQTRTYMRTLRIKNREKALQYYGGNPPQCKNCKYSDVRSLDLDHIKNDGSSHRKALGNYSLYAWLKKNNYPKGFQVLCRNCNWIKYSEKREIERIKREKLKN